MEAWHLFALVALVAGVLIAALAGSSAAASASSESAPAASGWRSLGEGWDALRRAARGGGDARITYSFVEPGVDVEIETPLLTVAEPDADGSVGRDLWKTEVAQAFAQWSAAFAAAFPDGSALQFVPFGGSGDEVPAEGRYLPLFHAEDAETASLHVGDIRVAVAPLGAQESTLAYAYGPRSDTNSGYTADMVFNASRDWRPDADVTDGGDGGYSVLYVATHELGHALGFGHHDSESSVMFPMAGLAHSLAARGGLAGSDADVAALREFYG